MIDHGRWSRTKGGCTWRFVCYFTYLTLARPKYHIDWKWLTPKLPWRTVRKFTVKWVSLFTCVPATQFALNGRNSSFKFTAAPHHLFKVTSFYMTAVIMKGFTKQVSPKAVLGKSVELTCTWINEIWLKSDAIQMAYTDSKYLWQLQFVYSCTKWPTPQTQFRRSFHLKLLHLLWLQDGPLKKTLIKSIF